jgi:prephenate dehydrogenase
LSDKSANVVGIGMIGGSIAAALRAGGWHVTGSDIDSAREEEAMRRGVVDAVGIDAQATITFIATPVSSVVGVADELLANGGLVTDVASVKGPVVAAIDSPNFVGGHPMAGSEHSGLDGVDADLFQGATWVLTPTALTSPDAYVAVANVVTLLGAHVVTLEPDEHDQIVATISHVPHLTATALMTGAISSHRDSDIVLRLAAGGFRDMTRIAAGNPDLWADIVLENRIAITDELGRLSRQIERVRDLVTDADPNELREFLSNAAQARRDLPQRSGRPSALSFVRIPIPDSAGALGEVLGVFGTLRVNVEDLEIAHDLKGDRGVLQVTIATSALDSVRDAFNERGIRTSAESA